VVYEGDHRQVSSGHVDPAGIREILGLLHERGFFVPWTPSPPNPAATGYDLQVNLKAGTFSYSGAAVGSLYPQLETAIASMGLRPFVPQEALLFVEAYDLSYPLPENLPVWPAQVGFALAEVPSSGCWIDGDALTLIWEAINGPKVPYTGFREEGKAYAVSLQLPGTLEFPFGSCD
jgi:hypothetical protein